MENKKVYKINLGKVDLFDFSERLDSDKKFIKWGEDNLFCDVLLNMLYNSPTHLNIVNKRKDMVLGDGINIIGTTAKKKRETEAFISSVNRHGETLEQVLEKIVYDYIVFGFGSLEVIWGKGLNRIAEIYHIPSDKIRFGKREERLNSIDVYYYCQNWKRSLSKEYKRVPLTPFSTVDEIKKVAPNQLMLTYKYSPGSIYPQPDYVGGLNYIGLEWSMGQFAQSHIKNGFFGNFIITQKNTNDEEKAAIVRGFQEQFVGEENANKIIYSFIDNLEDIRYDKMDEDGREEMIKTLADLATKNILQCHSIPPILAGIETSGKLGSGEEINNAFLEYESSKIAPMRNVILQNINKILDINDLDKVEFASSTPIPFSVSENVMAKVLTIDEIRKTLGYEDLPQEEYDKIVDVIVANKQAPIQQPETVMAKKVNKRTIKN